MPHKMDVVINQDCAVIPSESKVLHSQGSVLLNFLVSLGYDPLDPPAAAVLKQSEHLDGDWLMLSPVHWQATHNDASIIAVGDELQLSEDESRSWFQLYADYLAVDKMKLHYYAADLWLLGSDHLSPIKAKPTPHIINKSLMPELAQLDATMHWQKFITESQMFFASHTKKTLLNGVWVWGGARLDVQKSTAVCVDEPFYDLARLCSSNVTLYNPAVSLKEFQILLLNTQDALSDQHQQELKKITTHWYWNNSAYTEHAMNWIIRLWRTLIHAH